MTERQDAERTLGGSLVIAGAMLYVAATQPIIGTVVALAASAGALLVASVAFRWLYLGGEQREDRAEDARAEGEKQQQRQDKWADTYRQIALCGPHRGELITGRYEDQKQPRPAPVAPVEQPIPAPGWPVRQPQRVAVKGK